MTSIALNALKNVVDGKQVDAVEGATMEVRNPATDEVLAAVPQGAAADVDRAVQAADRAFQQWRWTTPRERAGLLHAFADAIDAHATELANLESLDVGKPKAAAIAEIEAYAADCVRFFAGAARCLDAPLTTEYMPGITSMIRREPVGVVGQVTPWNYPVIMGLWKLAPAIAAGNTVVLKPAEQAPLSTMLLGQLAAEILPPGVLNIITGNGEHVGAAMAEHPTVAMISVTGSVETGQAVAAAASRTLKRVHLELGGKTPVVVFDDADIESMLAELRTGAFWNAGQDCTASSRLLVGEAVAGPVLDELTALANSLRVGDPTEDVDMGPVISREQQTRILDFVAETHGNVLTGGSAPSSPGYFVSPTIIAEVDQSDPVVQNEIFGPVVSVQTFTTEAEAWEKANGVPYGLASSVWTRDFGRGMRAARTLDFGSVWLNCNFHIVSEMPHGGRKQSGYGSDLSKLSLEEYMQAKHVMAGFDAPGGH